LYSLSGATAHKIEADGRSGKTSKGTQQTTGDSFDRHDKEVSALNQQVGSRYPLLTDSL